MDKDSIVVVAHQLVEAGRQAQDWVSRNGERVTACGKSKEKVLASLRQQTRLLRRLERAAQRKMCAGVFGPSQAGKSYLLSSLAADSEKKVPCVFGNQEYDFIKDLNPGGSKESTGLVTRFTMTRPQGVTDEYPVHVRLLSETELVKIFTNSYFGDCEHKEGVSEETTSAIQQALEKLKSKACPASGHITLDDMEDLHEYVRNSFGGMARAAELDRVYWNEATELAPKLSVEDRAKLFGIIWGDIPEFTDMFLSLAKNLEKLGNPEEAFFSMDALVPREASIIDVETLGRTDFSEYHIAPTIKVRTPSGVTAEISRKNATAIVAELTLVMKNKPADYFDHTDLLDFPGYKARLECSDIADYLRKGKDDSKVEQFFRRGKVAYLFQRYNAERELTSLMLCVATPDNTPGLPGAVEEWIIATHGKTPQDRIQTKNALLYILTKSDRHFEEKGGANPETHWDDVLKGMFVNHFSGAYSQSTKWVEEWNPGQPFNNLFMLRNINIKWGSMMDYDRQDGVEKETGIRDGMQEYAEKMKKYFTESRLAKRHFRSPQMAYDEVMKLNDGGICLIKRSLEPLCEPNLKLTQIANALAGAQQMLAATIAPLYHSGNQEEEQKKKLVLFGSFGKLFANPNFQERFPEMLSNFKIAPEQLFYLYGDAERMLEEYREEAYAPPLDEENGEQALDADTPMAELDDVLGFFDDPAPQETPGGATTAPAGEKDEAHFYAARIVEAWSDRMRSMAENTDSSRYYLFPKNIFLGMLDEFDLAIERLRLREQMEKRFRMISEPVDVPKDSKIRKQASYAIGMLNDFISWMGKNPAETNESQRRVQYQGKDVTVFRNKPAVEGNPVLAETYTPCVRQWFKDWLTTFYGMLMDNVSFDGGEKINLEENAKIGKIVQTVNEARVN